MKKIFDSSKTITHRVIRTSSKARRDNCNEISILDGRAETRSPPEVLTTPKRCLSVCSVARKDVQEGRAAENSHTAPERCNLYWSLDEDNKRKITDPAYVKQAVQETFMQRAQGAYNYRRPANLPVQHTSVSYKTTFAPNRKSQTSIPKIPNKPKPVKPPPPSQPEKFPQKPQAPKRKRLIDTAKPIKHIVPSHARGRVKLGEQLKDSGLTQLEAARKKMYDPTPTVLGYLMEKHAPKISELSLKTRKEKYIADTAESSPFVQRVLGWGTKGVKKSEPDTISITPRAIEVKKVLSGKKKAEASIELLETRKNEKKGGIFQKSMRGKHEKGGSEERKQRRTSKAQEDREIILSKMRTTAVAKPSQVLPSVKKQVRDLELTPQMYPKGSLSLKKSYLPILPCRQVASRSPDPGSTIPDASNRLQTSASQETTKRPSSFTDQIVNSFKSLMMKMRPSST